MYTFSLVGLNSYAQTKRDPFLYKAHKLMDDVEYQKAAKVLRLGLAREYINTDLLIEHFLLQGICYVSLGRKKEAHAVFRKILTVSSDYKLSADISPKIQKVFDRTKVMMKQAGLLQTAFHPNHVPLSIKKSGVAVVVSIGFEENIDEITLVRLFFRRKGTSVFSSVDARPKGDRFNAVIPSYLIPVEEDTYQIEYYLNIYDSSQISVASVGSEDLALSFTVLSQQEIAKGEELSHAEEDKTLPLIIGTSVLSVAVIGVAALLWGTYLFRDKRGDALVIVSQQ